ncbi:hypothetical protein CAOG_03193 [Capsaspora owczarzaki ATCC 30864]|uniref:KAT8 regulatory NSL complex subunit 2 n=1 Tax=Capsaspora owczarzaki (strain ATCC 30864) TaxID=595528 RepID=A0A0D2VP55_CAPO3|nr:hypothetical protein CAOG_03193 [Capsaspora owczarzaki ATCC 30864]KJE92177.1 hypothetical protein CAOG_003193 [Capsaspora owczarzaki ATCC 30864]|eukprot:XP_004364032.2 hypothetical protein CAOG_03193 [Capsaspora owczarzaki ATCC 30864]
MDDAVAQPPLDEHAAAVNNAADSTTDSTDSALAAVIAESANTPSVPVPGPVLLHAPAGLTIEAIDGLLFEVEATTGSTSAVATAAADVAAAAAAAAPEPTVTRKRVGTNVRYLQQPQSGAAAQASASATASLMPCTFSGRICVADRIPGYGFCARHILEDTTAPWRQCQFVSSVTGKRCPTPVSTSAEVMCCDVHVQIMNMSHGGGAVRQPNPSSSSSSSSSAAAESVAAASSAAVAAAAVAASAAAAALVAAQRKKRPVEELSADELTKVNAANSQLAAVQQQQRKRVRFLQTLSALGVSEESTKMLQVKHLTQTTNKRMGASHEAMQLAASSLNAGRDDSSDEDMVEPDEEWFCSNEEATVPGPDSSLEPLVLQDDFLRIDPLRNAEILSEKELYEYRISCMERMRELYTQQFQRLTDVLERKCRSLARTAEEIAGTQLAQLPPNASKYMTDSLLESVVSSLSDREGTMPLLTVSTHQLNIKRHRRAVDVHNALAAISKRAISEQFDASAKDQPMAVVCAFDNPLGRGCLNSPLPLSKYCSSHILKDPLQVLFRQCQFTDSRSAQETGQPLACTTPVLVSQHPPLCASHLHLHAFPQLDARRDEANSAVAAQVAATARVTAPLKRSSRDSISSSSSTSKLRRPVPDPRPPSAPSPMSDVTMMSTN